MFVKNLLPSPRHTIFTCSSAGWRGHPGWTQGVGRGGVQPLTVLIKLSGG